MAIKDKELEAIGAIIELLEPLGENERGRVLEYVLKRLEMTPLRPASPIAENTSAVADRSLGLRSVVDIRSLTAEKQPRSANEMTALIAYYVSELAPEGEKSSTINSDIVKRYFKMAAFPLPSSLRNIIPNASAAGYLESAGRGEYRLNPVGYNLVVHGLPRSGSPGPTGIAGRTLRGSKKGRKARA